MYRYYMVGPGHGGWSVLGIIGGIALVILVILAIVVLVRWGLGVGGSGGLRSQSLPTAPGQPHETPLQVLDRRLADGQITVEDYEQRRAILEQRAGGKPAA